MTTKEIDNYPWTPLAYREACCVPVPHFRVQRLGLKYADKPALRDVSFDIYRGCITSVVGPSGCGKTSFLMALNRLCDLIPGCTTSGLVEFDGGDVRAGKASAKILRTKVGMIFQKPNPFPLSIRRNLELPLREHGTKARQELMEAVEEALKKVGLWDEVKDRLDSPALALSGGQQQRLCIARAICLKPEVLLMDEPCSALDPIASATIENLITSWRGKYTIVIVTHNLAQARRISDHTAFFWYRQGAGELIEYAETAQLFEQSNHELTAAYIGGIKG